MNRTDTKILWLSVLQGWAMLLVVIGHANFYEFMHGGFGSDVDWLHRFAYAFHMPLFMFVSGGLFYMTRVGREWRYRDVVTDKLKRLAVPYVVFTLFAFVLKASLSSHMKRGVKWSAHDFACAFLYPSDGPLAEMWFVASLFLLMMLYPLYRVAMRRRWSEMALLVIWGLLLICGPSIPSAVGGLFSLRDVPSYGIYFFGGMVCFKYGLYRHFDSWIVAGVCATLFGVSWLLGGGITLLTPMLGILMSLSVCMIVCRKLPSLFSSFRDFTFQIYLVGLYPQMLLELFVWNRIPHTWPTLVACYVGSVVLALYVPVVLSRLVVKYCPPHIRMWFGLR